MLIFQPIIFCAYIFILFINSLSKGMIFLINLGSKLCPVTNRVEPGKIMEVEKVLVLKPKTGEKYYTFDGIYDHLCTNKKNSEKDVKN